MQFLLKNQGGQAEQDRRNDAAECGGCQDADADEARDGAIEADTDEKDDGQHSGAAESQPVGDTQPFVGILRFETLGKPKRHEYHQDIVDDEEGFFKVARQSQQGFQVHFIFLVSECCNVAWYGLFEAGCFIFSDGLKLQAV